VKKTFFCLRNTFYSSICLKMKKNETKPKAHPITAEHVVDQPPASRKPTVRCRPRAWPCGFEPSAIYWNLQQTSYSSHPPIRLGTKHTQVQKNCLWKNNNYNNFVIRTTTLWCTVHSVSLFWFSIRFCFTLVGQKMRKTNSVYQQHPGDSLLFLRQSSILLHNSQYVKNVRVPLYLVYIPTIIGGAPPPPPPKNKLKEK